MAYVPVRKILEVSEGRNIVYSGRIDVCTDYYNSKGVVYISNDNVTFTLDKNNPVKQTDGVLGEVWRYGSQTKSIIGKLIVFKMIIAKRPVLYLTITESSSNLPYLIYKESIHGPELCYKFIGKNKGIHKGVIGEMDNFSYNIAINKSRLLDKPMPKKDYIKSARTLLQKVLNSNIPLAYNPSHEDIVIDKDIHPYEINKLYFKNRIDTLIGSECNSFVYYSNELKTLEQKFKILNKYFKYTQVKIS